MDSKNYIPLHRNWMGVLDFDNNGQNLSLIPRGIKLIGLRFYPGGVNDDERNKAKHIQKSMWGKANWFYFCKGFEIKENSDKVVSVEAREDAFDSTMLLYSEEQKVKICLNAIVGENGTGKSTILDTIIRVMNNLAAAIYGEDYNYTSAEHLHYIDYVYASLAVYIEDRIEIITCKGREFYITRLNTDVELLSKAYDVKDRRDPVTEVYKITSIETLLDGTSKIEELLPAQEEKKGSIRHLFYTLVSNYSLYAYNYRDYLYERTNEKRLEQFMNLHPGEYNEEDAYWLKGVFHKNDGYQTPVVIHPMREDGFINAAKVNYLGKHNLISLAFEKRERVNRDGLTEKYFPFREINKTHHIVAFYFYQEEYGDYKGFWEDCAVMRFNRKWAEQNKTTILKLEQPIKSYWSETLGLAYTEQKKNNRLQQAWDYLTYKTIKVLYTYIHYSADWFVAQSSPLDLDALNKSLNNLLKDSTHRTAKLRRTISYLRFREENDYYLNKAIADLNISYEWMINRVGEQLYPNNNGDYHKIEIEDLLPPPFVNVVLQLVDNEHLSQYVPEGSNREFIPFEGLSSGERQIAYSIANIVYHLKNIESSKMDMNAGPQHMLSLRYNYVNILLDEVELYFHPDLQRRFVSLLINSIDGLQLRGIFGINVTLVTHSPFVLSDIPSSNILYLSRDECTELPPTTFAANIHNLFNDAFFLPNTMGEIAQSNVGMVVNYYHTIRQIRERNGDWQLIDNRPQEVKEFDSDRVKYVASIVGDEYLHDELNDMVDEIKEWEQEDNKGKNEED